ncbi:MAG: hypothetical protein E6Q83_00255 [Thiothrix sp.]|nr:MAG: hypothetical protein E6Q83_00255 [Thiothrix sp.]
MKAHTFEQKLQRAQQHISQRLSHAEPSRVNGLRAKLWVRWMKQQKLLNESHPSRYQQGGQA